MAATSEDDGGGDERTRAGDESGSADTRGEPRAECARARGKEGGGGGGGDDGSAPSVARSLRGGEVGECSSESRPLPGTLDDEAAPRKVLRLRRLHCGSAAAADTLLDGTTVVGGGAGATAKARRAARV